MDQMDSAKLMFDFFNIFNDIFFENARPKLSNLTEDNIKSAHFKTIVYLYVYGTSTMTDISRWIDLEKGSFTPVANKLIDLSYIARQTSPTDKRKSLLSLTEKGDMLAQKVLDIYSNHFSSKILKLSKREQTSFSKSLQSIYELLIKIKE